VFLAVSVAATLTDGHHQKLADCRRWVDCSGVHYRDERAVWMDCLRWVDCSAGVHYPDEPGAWAPVSFPASSALAASALSEWCLDVVSRALPAVLSAAHYLGDCQADGCRVAGCLAVECQACRDDSAVDYWAAGLADDLADRAGDSWADDNPNFLRSRAGSSTQWAADDNSIVADDRDSDPIRPKGRGCNTRGVHPSSIPIHPSPKDEYPQGAHRCRYQSRK
jgi:hypothetical protein